MQDCPTLEQLEALLDHETSEPTDDAVLEHLSTCERCRDVLDHLSEGGGDWSRWEALLVDQHQGPPRVLPSDRLAMLEQEEDEKAPAPSTLGHLRNDTPTGTVQTSPADPLKVLSIPGYEILGRIGQGGMGVIYKARQLSLRRLVALKALKNTESLTLERRARFQREAQAIARLQDPRIVQIYEVGEHQGQLYYAMELIEGPNLAVRLQHTPQSPTWTAAVVEQLARGVHAAHEQGIVHRDLKPANVLLIETEDPPKVKITDFGLAKDLTTQEHLTETGVMAGTPAYVSPEQARADHQQIGPASDIYALGVILYEHLTGRVPFLGDSHLVTLRQIVLEEPIAPTALQGALPRDLETICLKCLEKDPKNRYPSALALAEDLQRFQRNEPIQARRVHWLGKMARWSKRRPATAALILVSLLALLTIVIGSNVHAVTMGHKNRELEKERNNAARERDNVRWEHENVKEEKKKVEAEKARVDRLLQKVSTSRYALQLVLVQRDLEDNNFVAANLRLDGCDPKLRGWEHGHLQWLCSQRLTKTFSEEMTPRSMTFSPDGSCLIVAGHNQGAGISIWDWKRGKRLRHVSTELRALFEARLSSDSQTLLVWGRVGTRGNFKEVVQAWDLKTGKVAQTWQVSRDFDPLLVASHNNEPFLFVKKNATSVELISPTTNRVVQTVPAKSKTIYSVTLSSDGRFLGVVEAHHPSPKRLLTIWNVHNNPPTPVHRSVSGRGITPLFPTNVQAKSVILVSDRGAAKRSLSKPDQQQLGTIRFSSEDRKRITVASPSGRYVASALNGMIEIHDFANTGDVRHVSNHGGRVLNLAFSADDRYLVSADSLRTLHVWDLVSDPSPEILQQHAPATIQLPIAVSPDNQWVATAGRQQDAQSTWQVKVSNLKTGKAVASWRIEKTTLLRHVRFSHDSKRLLGLTKGMDRLEWDFRTGRLLRTITAPAGQRGTTSVTQWSRNGLVGVTGIQETVTQGDGTRAKRHSVRIQNLDAKGSETVERIPISSVVLPLGMAVSPRGDRFAITSIDPPRQNLLVQVYDTKTRKLLNTFPHDPQSLSPAFSPDGKRLAIISKPASKKLKAQLRVRDVASKELLMDVPVRTAYGAWVTFGTRSDRLLVLRGLPGESMLEAWDVSTRQKLLELDVGPTAIRQMRMAPDDRTLVTADSEGTVKVWRARMPEP